MRWTSRKQRTPATIGPLGVHVSNGIIESRERRLFSSREFLVRGIWIVCGFSLDSTTVISRGKPRYFIDPPEHGLRCVPESADEFLGEVFLIACSDFCQARRQAFAGSRRIPEPLFRPHAGAVVLALPLPCSWCRSRGERLF